MLVARTVLVMYVSSSPLSPSCSPFFQVYKGRRKYGSQIVALKFIAKKGKVSVRVDSTHRSTQQRSTDDAS